MKGSEVGQSISQYAVRVVAPALASNQPSKPNKRLILLLSLCSGGAVGLSLALGSKFFDTSLKTVDEAERALGLRAIGAIPTRRRTRLADSRVLLIDRPHSAVAETFRALRTALRFAVRKEDYRTILFTSAIPEEGKSFCAINFSVALAQQGYVTLLIDGDLRLPSVGSVFFPGKELIGTSDVLRATSAASEAIHPTTIANLSVMPGGTPPPNRAELMTEAALAELLRQVRSRFQRIVIDTAPVHAVAEPLLMAAQADVVCFVVRAGKTKAPVAARAIENLRQSGASIPGFILNGLPTNNGQYY
jgi:capsular exopolysaccharide synthesis family protein